MSHKERLKKLLSIDRSIRGIGLVREGKLLELQLRPDVREHPLVPSLIQTQLLQAWCTLSLGLANSLIPYFGYVEHVSFMHDRGTLMFINCDPDLLIVSLDRKRENHSQSEKIKEVWRSLR